MSNRNRSSALPITVFERTITIFARITASAKPPNRAFPATKTSAKQYQKPYGEPVSIRYSICPKCPSPNLPLHLPTNKPLMFVPGWVSKCNAVRSRSSFPANYSRFRYQV